FLSLFFSSRRRHTSFSRDWSSDVCSSDLRLHYNLSNLNLGTKLRYFISFKFREEYFYLFRSYLYLINNLFLHLLCKLLILDHFKIGRASCRERVYISVVCSALS